MKADKENRTIEWVAFNNDLLNLLKQKDNHRFSRYDAFIWLIEKIRKGHTVYDEFGTETKRQELVITYTRLSDDWCWSRPTVQKFMEELIDHSIISQQKSGNDFILSLNSTTADKIIL